MIIIITIYVFIYIFNFCHVDCNHKGKLKNGLSTNRVARKKRFTSATARLLLIYCVVPENIQTPTTEGIGNSEGVGGSMAQEIPKGRGLSRPNSLPDGRENDCFFVNSN